MPHIKYLIHFFPLGTAFLLNEPEQWWSLEQLILNYMKILNKVENFGLRASATVNHPVNFFITELGQYLLDHRCIGSGR